MRGDVVLTRDGLRRVSFRTSGATTTTFDGRARAT